MIVYQFFLNLCLGRVPFAGFASDRMRAFVDVYAAAAGRDCRGHVGVNLDEPMEADDGSSVQAAGLPSTGRIARVEPDRVG
jgi:hypothetical protein